MARPKAVPSTATYQPRTNKNTLLSYQQTMSPTLLNDFRIGWHRLELDTVNNFHLEGDGTARSDLGIPGFDSDVRYDNFYQVDMRVEKQFTFGRTKWSAAFDVFNLLNSNVVLGREDQMNSTRANFVEEVLAPRVARFGVRMSF